MYPMMTKGCSMPTKPRQLARDVRSGKEGEVMAEPLPPGRRNYWLRPVGGGVEWEAPKQFVQLIDDMVAAEP